jgi:hypothetical protein
MSGIMKAVEASGSARRLAQSLGVSHQAVCKWKRRGWVPMARAIEIEVMHDIPRRDLLNPAIAVLLTD